MDPPKEVDVVSGHIYRRNESAGQCDIFLESRVRDSILRA